MTTLETGGSAVALAWKRYRGWALTARKLKSTHERSYLWVSGLSLLGAIAGIVAQQVVTAESADSTESVLKKGVAVLSALCVAVSAYLARQLLGVERETQWVRARGLAEALKSHVYLFYMGVVPYQESASGVANPQKRLLDKVSQLEKAGEHLHREEPSAAHLGAPPAESSMTVDDYIRLRIQDQIDYYRTQGARHQALLRRYQTVGLVLGLVGTLLGFFGATNFGARMVAWVAVISTAAMGLAGFATAGRYQYLATTYRAAADQLEYLRAVWSSSQKTPEDQRRLVLDVEALLRAENSAWVVDRTTHVSAHEVTRPEPQ